MASIRLEDDARKDPRFVILGKRLKTTRFDARARMEELWAYCTDKQTYYLDPEIIDALAEFDGFSQLICDKAVDLAEVTDQGIRIKGTQGRIEWLGKLRENGKLGGRPKKEDALQEPMETAPTTEEIPFDNQTETKQKPEGNQEVTKSEPEANPLTLTLINKDLIHEHRKQCSRVKTEFDLEKLYQGYPRKKGKTPGMKRLAKEIRTQDDYEALARAIQNYVVETAGREPQHIAYFSTFVNQWRDWVMIEPDATPYSINTKPIDLEAV